MSLDLSDGTSHIEEVKKRIIVPLDVATEKEAINLVLTLRNHVGLFKIGLELLSSVGISIVKRINDLGAQVFMDGKFNDIPNTVAGASRGVARLRVRMFSLHTMGGLEMMASAVTATKDEASATGAMRPLILGVTILTSLDLQAMNDQLRISGNVEDQVVHLARLAEKAGLDGVISSPHEIEPIRRNVSDRMLIVTPGVRPVWATANDQKRIMTPGEAISKGASYLVIGRPITKPPAHVGTPKDAAVRISKEILDALAGRHSPC